MAKSFMELHFKKKTRRIDKSVTVGNIRRIGKIIEKFIGIQSQTLYIPQETLPCSLRKMERPSALCEPFEIEKNDQGRVPIRVSREFVTKLNMDDLAGRARKEKLVCSRGKGRRPNA